MSVESGSQFLKEKYDLHTTLEVEEAAERTEQRTNEEVAHDPASRIENYLNRFNEIADREDPAERDRGVEALKRVLHDKFVIKPDEIPESYWETQRRMARELGHGDIEITDELRRQNTEIIITDQQSSLDKWIDYLASEDATYPMWLKYFAVRGVLNMSTYDKEKHEFATRSKGTTAPFPDLDREALAYVLDAVEKRQGPEYRQLTQQIRQEKNELKRLKGTYRVIQREGEGAETQQAAEQIEAQQNEILTLEGQQKRIVLGSQEVSDQDQERFRSMLDSADFAKLYVWAAEQVTPAEENELLQTEGEWIKFDQNSDHLPLVKSLQGHGTGWCTAGESTAEAQLQGGDFYVYYSKDKHGSPTVPRAAIRMEGDNIAEVRGVAAEQNLDPYIADVVRGKMHTFPDGEQYEKKAYDMQMVTYLDRKAQAGEQLTKDDLTFLYEIDSPIQGFGYQRDPRINELRAARNPEADMPLVFECEPEQIARSIDQINEHTKAYVGPIIEEVQNPQTREWELKPEYHGIFQKLANLEHVYTQFPEGKIRHSELEIGGLGSTQLEQDMRDHNINISQYALDMMSSRDFTFAKDPEVINLIRLKVGDVWQNGNPTTDQLYERIENLGLELCPPETGPHQRLKDLNQPLGDWYRIGMKQIPDRNGNPIVFNLGRTDYGLWLNNRWAKPDNQWSHDDEFVFRLRKDSPEPETLKPFVPKFEI